jgi:hypothetical protein
MPCSGQGANTAQLFTFGADGLLSSIHTDFWLTGSVRKCIGVTATPIYPDPAGPPHKHAKQALPLQLWAKPQPCAAGLEATGCFAVLILNMAGGGGAIDVTVDFAADLRDVWRHADVGETARIEARVDWFDSAFYLLTRV